MRPITLGKEVIYLRAPCRPGREIVSEGQEETKEGTCYCPENPKGCCVDELGRLLPLQLKKDVKTKERLKKGVDR